MAKENVYLESKPRYEILDGLRGVAAMLVVIFHLFETYSDGPEFQTVNHGYLAVDFFFVLSGFVVGYAYDDRWDRMTTWGFFKRRLIRLHAALKVEVWDIFESLAASVRSSQYPPITTLLYCLSILLVTDSKGMHSHSSSSAIHLAYFSVNPLFVR